MIITRIGLSKLYGINFITSKGVHGHEGGRNRIRILSDNQGKSYVLRISQLADRTENDYLAETEFVHYLAENGARVADIIPSRNGRQVEKIGHDKPAYLCLFEYAPGMLICDNDYRYRNGAPLSEYFYNTGKTLGRIHALAKDYKPVHRRADYSDKYNPAYIDQLMDDSYSGLKQAISQRLVRLSSLKKDHQTYGLVHFDFSDGNYHINMENGDITVFDFDNALYCWYMYDLANLWIHGEGWFQFEEDADKRREGMTDYFNTVLDGYRSETDLPAEMLEALPLFIDMVLIENIVDEFECAERDGTAVDPEDIGDAAECLINAVPWAGFFEKQ